MEQENTNREGRFARLVAGLSKTRAQMAEGLAEVFSSEVIDDDFFDDLEEVLIESDMGPQTAVDIVDQLRLLAHIGKPLTKVHFHVGDLFNLLIFCHVFSSSRKVKISYFIL